MFKRENYYCAACDKLLPVSPAMFKVGEKASFTKSVINGRRIRMTSVKGIVLSLGEKTLQVLYQGESKTMSYKDCMPEHAPSALTYAFIGHCECVQQAEVVETE